MNYDTESWYKLYIRESTEDRLLAVLNRALRDFLLRLAKSRTDGTILAKTASPGEDVARALGAHPDEVAMVVAFVESMLVDGYLSHRKGRLWITNFVEAQAARSPGARRQKTYRDNRKKSRNDDATGERDDDDESVTGDVTGDERETSQERRSEERRDEKNRGEKNARGGATRPKDPLRKSLTPKPDRLPADWAPGPEHAELAKRLGLDVEAEAGEYRAWCASTDRECGNWPADFELWLRRSKRFERKREAKRGSGTATHGGPSDDWPTDADVSLRERIRGGEWGDALAAELAAGKLDASLARRRIAELNDRTRRARAEGGRATAGAALAAVLPGGVPQ